jgi:hypothetical protein
MGLAEPPPRAARFLEQTLLWNILIHVAALVTMGLLLLPGMPGGPVTDAAGRIAYVADHPWRWRLGWVPWHLAALIDVLTGVALVCTRWVPRLPAVLTLAATLCAVVPEQTGELAWSARGPALAEGAQHTGEAGPYLALEERSFHLAVVVGASLYLVMALGWTWCFAAAGLRPCPARPRTRPWSRLLTWLTPFTWGSLALASVGLLLPEGMRPGPLVVALSNGLGFGLLVLWLVLVAEQVLRRARPVEPHGRLAPWRHPWRGPFGRLLDVLANSRLLRAYAEWAPVPAFLSDITDVVYVNYLVEAKRLEGLVPAGLELQRLGPDKRYALFTFLTHCYSLCLLVHSG